MRRFMVFAYLVSFFILLGPRIATIHAEPYPERSLELIIPIPAGGGGDVNARLLIDPLEKILGQKIIASNKPGASDTIGTDLLVKSKKDGYTIGYTSSAALVYSRLVSPDAVSYDPVKDLEPLGLHTFFPLAIAVQASSPWKTFKDLVDYARNNPEKLRVSTAGMGSTSNFDVQLTQSLTGAQFTHVPFKGGQAVITALLGGHVEVTFDIVGKFAPHVNAGKLRLLAISRKVPIFPDLPTLTELGYKRDLLSGWHAMFAPAGIPDPVKKVLVPAIEKSVNDPEVKAKIEKLGYVVDYQSPQELEKLMIDDYETAKEIAIRLGLHKK